jgi:hypothetical protein
VDLGEVGQDRALLRPPSLLTLKGYDLLLAKLAHKLLLVDGPQLESLEILEHKED